MGMFYLLEISAIHLFSFVRRQGLGPPRFADDPIADDSSVNAWHVRILSSVAFDADDSTTVTGATNCFVGVVWIEINVDDLEVVGVVSFGGFTAKGARPRFREPIALPPICSLIFNCRRATQTTEGDVVVWEAVVWEATEVSDCWSCMRFLLNFLGNRRRFRHLFPPAPPVSAGRCWDESDESCREYKNGRFTEAATGGGVSSFSSFAACLTERHASVRRPEDGLSWPSGSQSIPVEEGTVQDSGCMWLRDTFPLLSRSNGATNRDWR